MQEAELELARVHLRLGDNRAESDVFEEAITEYEACLAIRSRLLPKHDRYVGRRRTRQSCRLLGEAGANVAQAQLQRAPLY
jgi:hypothetical protein